MPTDPFVLLKKKNSLQAAVKNISSQVAALSRRNLQVGTVGEIATEIGQVIMITPGTLSVSSGNEATGNHTHAITSSSVPGTAASLLATDASGHVTLEQVTTGRVITTDVGSSLIPSLVDTYDLGSSTKLWRKGYLSELDAVLFAINTVTLLGGWLLVGKDEGTLGADVTSGATTVNFGKAMTVGHFVLMRAVLQVEYMQVGSLVSGTTYNVTRNLDGSGANSWAKGTPFAVLGTTGDGRIELNAYDTPRISIIKQGAAYNAQTELIRMGDLNGNWGYVAQTFGMALGEYAANRPNITIDPTNGLRLRTYTTTVMQFDVSGNADITGKLRMPGASSAIAIGATPPTSASAGTGIWLDRTGLYGLAANVEQFSLDATNGKAYAGAGNVVLDINGISISATIGADAYDAKKSLRFNNGAINCGKIWLWDDSLNFQSLRLTVPARTGYSAEIEIGAYAPANYAGTASLKAYGNSSAYAIVSASANAVGGTLIQLLATTTSINGGLNVGTAIGAGTGSVFGSGVIRMLGTGANYVLGKFGVGAGPEYNFDNIVLAGADRLMMRSGISGITDGFTLFYTHVGTILTMNLYGQFVVGNPTGGAKGIGTINAKAVYDDGAGPLTDYVFEPGYKFLSIEGMRKFYTSKKHLPTLPGMDEWKEKKGLSLGKMSIHLWETIEVQALYITELHNRLSKLEKKNQMK